MTRSFMTDIPYEPVVRDRETERARASSIPGYEAARTEVSVAPAETLEQARLHNMLNKIDNDLNDEALMALYRAWRAMSYSCPPNQQAVASAVAWGQYLKLIILQDLAQKTS